MRSPPPAPRPPAAQLLLSCRPGLGLACSPEQEGERLRREGGRPAQRLRDTNLGWPVQVAEVGCWVQMQSLAPVGLPRAHADLPGLCLEEEESPALRVSL